MSEQWHLQGASKVLVEQKAGNSTDFGKGRKVHMTFADLMDKLHQGSDSLYLTTQEVQSKSSLNARFLQSLLTTVFMLGPNAAFSQHESFQVMLLMHPQALEHRMFMSFASILDDVGLKVCCVASL